MRKNDLQGGTRPPEAQLDKLIECSTINGYRVEFLNLHSELKSWRKVADRYGIYPNMARMISQGYDPGNRIRKLLRLPMKDKFEVCPKCKLPMRKGHECQAKKRNRLSINLDNPGSAARSIMKYMDLDLVEVLIEMLMEGKIDVLEEEYKCQE